MRYLSEHLDRWATQDYERPLYRFLSRSGEIRSEFSYGSFSACTKALAAYLAQTQSLRHGERVLLIYPPGLEIACALVACSRIGVIAVPVAPPSGSMDRACLDRVAFMARDCGAVAVLTTECLRQKLEPLVLASVDCSTNNLRWIATDTIDRFIDTAFPDNPNSILFLQYTSGSTRDPRGVIVSHKNILCNAVGTVDHVPIGVSWLPQHHDMGLIGYYLFPIISGGMTVGFSPFDFLRRPRLWFETITTYRATFACAPNFAFEYCLRESCMPSEQLQGLDLSSLRVMMSAAEPALPETYAAFASKFAAVGLKAEAHRVAYGLAENTLAVTHGGTTWVTPPAQSYALPTDTSRHSGLRPNPVMSCGKPVDGVRVRIVDTVTGSPLADGKVGEVWVTGSSKCAGYWAKPDLTQAVFEAVVQDDPGDGSRYLRTGDLGFLHDGELFVCGRLKDVIIVRGTNYYPAEIERAVEIAIGETHPGRVVAFAGGERDGPLVILVEAGTQRQPDISAIVRAVQSRCQVTPSTIAIVPGATIAQTTSGKLARARTREHWTHGEITARSVSRIAPSASGPEAPRERLRNLLAQRGLCGEETITLGEAGIDSLDLVAIIENLEALLQDRGETMGESRIDIRLIQEMRITDFFRFMTLLDTAPLSASTAIREYLESLGEKQASDEREAMRFDARLDVLPAPSGVPPVERPDQILLTGATGFFGPFLLAHLLRNNRASCHVLVRTDDRNHGMQKIVDSLRDAALLDEAMKAAVAERVHVVVGDVSRAGLGMDPRDLIALAERIDTVLHNAACVNYLLNYRSMRPHNVDGTRHLLHFAATNRTKAFHLVSSTIIFGWTPTPILLETDANESMANLDFGYAQTKWVAERLAWSAMQQGLRVSIYRPSFITAAANGVASRSDIVIRLLCFMIKHRIAVIATNQVSFLPADVAAAHIAGIVQRGGCPGKALHVTADGYYSLTDVTRIISARYGYTFEYYDIPAFVVEMERRCTPDDLLYPLVNFFVHAWPKLDAMKSKRYDNTQYRATRIGRNDGTAEPALEATVSYLMAFMLREGLIQPSAPPSRSLSVAGTV